MVVLIASVRIVAGLVLVGWPPLVPSVGGMVGRRLATGLIIGARPTPSSASIPAKPVVAKKARRSRASRRPVQCRGSRQN